MSLHDFRAMKSQKGESKEASANSTPTSSAKLDKMQDGEGGDDDDEENSLVIKLTHIRKLCNHNSSQQFAFLFMVNDIHCHYCCGASVGSKIRFN